MRFGEENMVKCEYCGKEIGLLAVRYTWLDKQNNRATHDGCYEKYKTEPPEKRRQISEEKQKKGDSRSMNSQSILGIIIMAIVVIQQIIIGIPIILLIGGITGIILFLNGMKKEKKMEK